MLHLGCGLDTRVFRIDPSATVRWYDVDLPDVIELRRQLYPARPGYEMIAASVADLQWLDSIPGDTPVLVVAEGLVQYLPVDDRGALFNRITEQFPSGEIIFDAYGRATTRGARPRAQASTNRLETVRANQGRPRDRGAGSPTQAGLGGVVPDAARDGPAPHPLEGPGVALSADGALGVVPKVDAALPLRVLTAIWRCHTPIEQALQFDSPKVRARLTRIGVQVKRNTLGKFLGKEYHAGKHG